MTVCRLSPTPWPATAGERGTDSLECPRAPFGPVPDTATANGPRADGPGMHREGHVGAALLVYAPVGFLAFVLGLRELALLGAAAAVALATLPDQDLRLPFVEHRGITHTVWFAGLVGAGLGTVGWFYGARTGVATAATAAAFGFAVGAATIGSHVLADALTPMGVTPFSPLGDRHYTFGLVRASNPIANYALLALGVGAAAGALVLAVQPG